MDILYRAGFIGDRLVLTLPLVNADGSAFTPGGDYALIFTAKRKDTDADADAVIQCASGAGIEESGSNAVITILPAATVDLSPCSLICDVQAQHLVTGEIVNTVAYLRLDLKRDVTRSTTTSIPVITTTDPLPLGPVVSVNDADELEIISGDVTYYVPLYRRA